MLATFVRRWEGQSCLSFHNRLSVGAACLISLVWVGPDDRRNLESLSRSALRRPLAKTGRRLALLLVAVGRYPENGVYAAAALSEHGYISRARQCERGVAGVGKDGGIKARLQAFSISPWQQTPSVLDARLEWSFGPKTRRKSVPYILSHGRRRLTCVRGLESCRWFSDRR